MGRHHDGTCHQRHFQGPIQIDSVFTRIEEAGLLVARLRIAIEPPAGRHAQFSALHQWP